MSIVKIPKASLKLETVVELAPQPIKDQIARVGKVGVMLERAYLEKPQLRLDIYEEINCNVVGAKTSINVIGKDMEHYEIENKYVRLLASSKLHEAINEALIYYRYEMDEYFIEMDTHKPLNVLKNFCIDAEISLKSVISITVDKVRKKGLNSKTYTQKEQTKYLNELGALINNDFFKQVALLLDISEEVAENRYAEGVLAFWLFNSLNMDPQTIDASFEWEDTKASKLISNHIFFILELHRAIENNI